ncbi:MAG: hypothetical protein GVY25_16460 [Bacteroidetes bacterium]|nr:hypothetical protein [Bacteroidota bacterium]
MFDPPAPVTIPAVVVAAFLLFAACDQAPGASDTSPESPVVADFAYSPDAVNPDTLSPGRVTDSTLTVDLRLVTAVTDADSEIERVVFTIEASSAPGSALDGTLPLLPGETDLYGSAIELTLPRADAVYTVRVFAVDTDSLTSNVGLGQVRVRPGTS